MELYRYLTLHSPPGQDEYDKLGKIRPIIQRFSKILQSVLSSVTRMRVRNSACKKITVYTSREVRSGRLPLPSTMI